MSDKSEAEETAERLLNDELPDTIEVMYLSLLFWPERKRFTDEVVSIIGVDAMVDRLAFKMQLWVPHALSGLRTDWGAIDSWIDLLIRAHRAYPHSIAPMFTMRELADVRRNAHIREGRKATEYLQSGETQMLQPNQMTLAHALLAGVPKPLVGNPPADVCAKALESHMPDKVEENLPWSKDVRRARQANLDHAAELNSLLNRFLRTAA